MSRDAQLRGLARIARLKADLELKQFAALRGQMAALESRVEDLRMEMILLADSAVRAWAGDGAVAPEDVGPGDTARPQGAAARGTAGVVGTGQAAGPENGWGSDHASRPEPAMGVRPPPDPDQSLRDTRIANALTRAAMLERQAVETERQRMTPQFEAARIKATRAFGRAEAVSDIGRQLTMLRRAQQGRRSEG